MKPSELTDLELAEFLSQELERLQQSALNVKILKEELSLRKEKLLKEKEIK